MDIAKEHPSIFESKGKIGNAIICKGIRNSERHKVKTNTPNSNKVTRPMRDIMKIANARIESAIAMILHLRFLQAKYMRLIICKEGNDMISTKLKGTTIPRKGSKATGRVR